MCDLTAIGLALSAASTVSGFVQQRQQHKAQEQAARQQQELVRRETINRYDKLAIDRERERRAQSEEIRRVREQGLRARERARTRAGEAGSAGLSLDALLRDVSAQTARAVEPRVDDNLFQVASSGLAANRASIDAQQRLVSLSRPRSGPNPFSAGARVVGALGELQQHFG